MSNFEKIYNSLLNKTFKYASPIKKIITTPNCKVHKYINERALYILKNNGYENIYDFYNKYYTSLTDGTVWADQDFRSSSHLYNPYTKKGLYGRKNAMDVCLDYYHMSIELYNKSKYEESLFYFGAALHIVQDMTVPHHASVRLLNKHKQLESYIRKNYTKQSHHIDLKPHILGHIAHYIDYNGKEALKIYEEAVKLEACTVNLTISSGILPLAKRSTAGCMIRFYNDIHH